MLDYALTSLSKMSKFYRLKQLTRQSMLDHAFGKQNSCLYILTIPSKSYSFFISKTLSVIHTKNALTCKTCECFHFYNN